MAQGKPEPGSSAEGAAAKAAREARLARALKANLQRRKVQQRGRQVTPPPGPGESPEGSGAKG
jgi:hypothetical protein